MELHGRRLVSHMLAQCVAATNVDALVNALVNTHPCGNVGSPSIGLIETERGNMT